MTYPQDAPKCTCGTRCVKNNFNGMYYCWESQENCSRGGVYLTHNDCEVLYRAEEREQPQGEGEK